MAQKDVAWVKPCKVVLFREQPYIKSNQILFIDNRPGREWSYHDKLVDVFGLLRKGELEIDPDDSTALRRIIEGSLANGGFRDTTQVARWIGAINYYADFASFGIKPLELVVAHAEDHIEELYDLVVENSSLPAGVILSGSPEMLSDLLDDPIMVRTLELIRFFLQNNIPIIGFCFGLHLLAYAKYGAKTSYIHVPDGMHVEFHPRWKVEDKFTGCTPGSRYAVYGTSFIRRVKKHKVMSAVDRVLGLEVHAQFLSPEDPLIPEDMVLAVSSRFFREKKMTKKQVEQVMIEVLQVGDVAIGTQLHPEIQPELLLALSYLPDIVEWLQGEGQNIEKLRSELKNYPKSYYAGQRIGYNWTKRIMAPQYIRASIGDERSQRILLNRLKYRDPLWGKFFGVDVAIYC